MIAIVSTNSRERAALESLIQSRGLPAVECDSLRAFRRLLHEVPLKVVVTRHRLGEAFSDDVMAALIASGQFADAQMIVLLEAGSSSALEARQVEMGASTVLRDPIRTEVLLAYLDKYWSQSASSRLAARHSMSPHGSFEFAGGRVFPVERKITRGTASIRVTPRELALITFLFEGRGQVVTYQTLYTEMLGRRFRGDNGNLRVLLAKLVESYQKLRVPLRRHIEVIPKTGYRYVDPASRG